MGSNLREALDTLLVALLAKALLDAELRLGRVDERARHVQPRGGDRAQVYRVRARVLRAAPCDRGLDRASQLVLFLI